MMVSGHHFCRHHAPQDLENLDFLRKKLYVVLVQLSQWASSLGEMRNMSLPSNNNNGIFIKKYHFIFMLAKTGGFFL